MNIKISNYDIEVLSQMYLEKDNILNTDEKQFPIKFLWTIEQNVKKIRAAAADLSEMRKKIDNSYTSDEYSFEENGIRKVKSEYIEEYSNKLNELYSLEIELDLKPIYIEDIEEFNITGSSFQSIKIMIASKDEDK